jgi:hypothetical protein
MADPEPPKAVRRPGRRNDPKALLRFIEELSWLLSANEDLDFKALGSLGNELAFAQRAPSSLRHHSSRRPPTTQFLVGVLPSLLTDEALFPANEDIIDFSRHALGITVPRWQKKSKFELIGHIVCNTEHADRARLDFLVRALADLLEDRGEIRRALQAERRSGASWNEVIQKLLRNG